MNPELLALLRCPETGQPLSPATPEQLAGQPFEAALVRADGAILYPIRGGIPVLLLEEAISVVKPL